jgi:glutamate--cysteine ligase
MIRAVLDGPNDRRIGAEVEWLVFDRARPERVVTADETLALAVGEPLPAAGTITIEPGGQLELSTVTFDDPVALAAAIDVDVAELVERFEHAGCALVPLGLDPLRPPVRTLDAARYRAMEEYFRRRSPEGVRMMASTAALQLSVDPGPDPRGTWQVLAAVAPVLSALFANSGDVVGRSERQRVWAATDPARTAPVPTDDVTEWVDYVLDAPVMLRAEGGSVAAPLRHRTFRAWLADAEDPPHAADLDVHLTTMFPPIRPRGHLEIRCIDAVPRLGRLAAIGAVWALVRDDGTGHEVSAACATLGNGWRRALDAGTDDPGLRSVAADLLDRAARSLADDAPALAEACRAWRARRIDTPPTPVVAAGDDVRSVLDALAERA